MTGEPEARRALDSIVGEAEDKIGRTATSMIFGKVLSSDPVAGTAVVALNGETSGTPGIKALRGYVPQAGEGVVLLKKGRQYVVLGSTKAIAPEALGYIGPAFRVQFWNPLASDRGNLQGLAQDLALYAPHVQLFGTNFISGLATGTMNAAITGSPGGPYAYGAFIDGDGICLINSLNVIVQGALVISAFDIDGGEPIDPDAVFIGHPLKITCGGQEMTTVALGNRIPFYFQRGLSKDEQLDLEVEVMTTYYDTPTLISCSAAGHVTYSQAIVASDGSDGFSTGILDDPDPCDPGLGSPCGI